MSNQADNYLPDDDFRKERAYLPDDAFALSSGHRPKTSDLMPEQPWRSLMDLPTDVVLMTSAQAGSMLAQMHELWGSWISNTITEPHDSHDYLFNPMLDAADEFNATTFIGAHGYYRQATGCLRSALETLVIAASLTVTNDGSLYRKWQAGEQLGFNSSLEKLAQSEMGKTIDKEFGGAGVFTKSDNSITKSLYRELCGYVHSQADATNGAIWNSNGPIWVSAAFEELFGIYQDTVALCYLLLLLGWEDFKLPAAAARLFKRKQGYWKDATTNFIKVLEDCHD